MARGAAALVCLAVTCQVGGGLKGTAKSDREAAATDGNPQLLSNPWMQASRPFFSDWLHSPVMMAAGRALEAGAMRARQAPGGSVPAAAKPPMSFQLGASNAVAKQVQQRAGERMRARRNAARANNKDGLQQVSLIDTDFDKGICLQAPILCKAPFTCQIPPTPVEAINSMSRVATADGKAHFRDWCRYPGLATSVVQNCLLSQNFDKAAAMAYELAVQGKNDEVEASRCFIEGHCLEAEVTNRTFASQAEDLCTRRYGDAWKEVAHSSLEFWQARETGDITEEDGIKDPKYARLMSMLACARGSFHCDVYTCKQTYCKREYYKAKYGHLQRKHL